MAGKRRDKGQSHSIRPVRVGPPKWVKYSLEEIGALAGIPFGNIPYRQV